MGVCAETERAIRDFVGAAVSRLSEALRESPVEWETDSRWERGLDGYFRERTVRTRELWRILTNERLQSLPGYETVVEHLRSRSALVMV
jgi:hypothetical protein